MSESRTKKVLINSGASISFKIVQVLTQFAIRTAFLYILGNEYTGIAGLFSDIMQVLSLMELGLDASMTFSLYAPLRDNNTIYISKLLRFYRKAFHIIGIVVALSGIACIPLLQFIVKDVPNISEDIRGIFLMYVLTTSMSYFVIYKTIILRADQRSYVISIVYSISLVLESVLEILFLIVIKRYYSYLIIKLIMTFARNIFSSAYTKRKYADFFILPDGELSRSEKRRLYRDLGCITMYHIAGVAIYSTDSIFISAFWGTAGVAIISNFTLIIDNIRKAIQEIFNVSKSSIGNLVVSTNVRKQKDVYSIILFIAFWMTCILCSCLISVLNYFVGKIWLNKTYEVENSIIILLLLNLFIAIIGFPTEAFRDANGLFAQGWPRPIVMTILNIVFDFFMGKKWGIVGILSATTLSRLLTQVWYDPYIVYKRVFNEKFYKYLLKYLEYLILTTGSCFLSYSLSNALAFSNAWINIVFRIIISFVISVILVVIVFRNSQELRGTFAIAEGILRKQNE